MRGRCSVDRRQCQTTQRAASKWNVVAVACAWGVCRTACEDLFRHHDLATCVRFGQSVAETGGTVGVVVVRARCARMLPGASRQIRQGYLRGHLGA